MRDPLSEPKVVASRQHELQVGLALMRDKSEVNLTILESDSFFFFFCCMMGIYFNSPQTLIR